MLGDCGISFMLIIFFVDLCNHFLGTGELPMTETLGKPVEMAKASNGVSGSVGREK